METTEMETRKQPKLFSIESLIAPNENKSSNKTPRLEIVNVTDTPKEENTNLHRRPNLGDLCESFLTSTPQLASRSVGLQERLSPDMRSPSPIGSEDGDKENKMTLLRVNTQKGQYSSPNTSNGSENSECDTSGSRRKKARTAFSGEQLAELERRFRLHKYLGTDERSKLAEELGLTDQQVKTWFQNRRMKEKRQIREMEQLQTIPMSTSLVASDPLHYPFSYSSSPVSSVSPSSLPGFTLLPPGFLPKPAPLTLTSGLMSSMAPMGHYAYSAPTGSPFHPLALHHPLPQIFPVRPMLQ